MLFAFLLYGGCGLHDTHENAAGRQGWRDLGRQQIWMEVKVAEQTLHVPREFAWGQAASPSQGSPCVGVHHGQRLTGGGVHDTRNATPSQTSPKTTGAPACSTGVAMNCFPEDFVFRFPLLGCPRRHQMLIAPPFFKEEMSVCSLAVLDSSELKLDLAGILENVSLISVHTR